MCQTLSSGAWLLYYKRLGIPVLGYEHTGTGLCRLWERHRCSREAERNEYMKQANSIPIIFIMKYVTLLLNYSNA